MSDPVRPGPNTGNQLVLREAAKANSGRLLSLDYFWCGRVTHRDFTAAATNETLTLRTLFATARGTYPDTIGANPIEDNAVVGEYYIDLIEAFSGTAIVSAAFILGRAGDTDAYLTTTDVFTGAALTRKITNGAAEYASRGFTTDFAPLLRLDTGGGNVVACDTGIADIYFKISPLPSRRPARAS